MNILVTGAAGFVGRNLVGDHDFTLPLNTELATALRSKDIPYSMHVSTGDHNWEFVAPAMEEALKRALRAAERAWLTR